MHEIADHLAPHSMRKMKDNGGMMISKYRILWQTVLLLPLHNGVIHIDTRIEADKIKRMRTRLKNL